MQVGWYDRKICRVRDLSCGETRIFLELEVRRLDCRNCGKVKRERLDFLADNPHYTKRFAYYVGRRSICDDQGRCGGFAAGLAYGQDSRPAVHASPACASGQAWSAGDRH